MPYQAIAIMIAGAIFNYRLGEAERVPGVVTALASVAISFVTMFWLGWGLIASLLAQGAIFLALWIRNVVRDTPARD